jgi:hypothetical protein
MTSGTPQEASLPRTASDTPPDRVGATHPLRLSPPGHYADQPAPRACGCLTKALR